MSRGILLNAYPFNLMSISIKESSLNLLLKCYVLAYYQTTGFLQVLIYDPVLYPIYQFIIPLLALINSS